jgi:hypothetical protein
LAARFTKLIEIETYLYERTFTQSFIEYTPPRCKSYRSVRVGTTMRVFLPWKVHNIKEDETDATQIETETESNTEENPEICKRPAQENPLTAEPSTSLKRPRLIDSSLLPESDSTAPSHNSGESVASPHLISTAEHSSFFDSKPAARPIMTAGPLYKNDSQVYDEDDDETPLENEPHHAYAVASAATTLPFVAVHQTAATTTTHADIREAPDDDVKFAKDLKEKLGLEIVPMEGGT